MTDLSKLSRRERIYIKRLSKKEGLTTSETLKRLLRVFKGALVLILILTVIGVNEFIKNENGSFYSYLFIYFLVLFIFYFLAPMKLGAKIIYYKLL